MTPTPWLVDENVPSQIRQPHGSRRRRIVCPPDADGIDDARRIVACVNACAGIPTGTLEGAKNIRIATCAECGRTYRPLRAAKRGQDSYCHDPACKAASRRE